MLGGLLALRLRDKLHLILGFSAGAVIGVAFFDLLARSHQFRLAAAHARPRFISWTGVGFLCYLVLDRLCCFTATRRRAAALPPPCCAAHSLLDGIAIGLAFQASRAVGIIVAIAVLTHDFSDGINTMTCRSEARGQSQRRAFAGSCSMRRPPCSASRRRSSSSPRAAPLASCSRYSRDFFSTSARAI